ncbi:hypothetical protein Tco_0184743 [Tanacetum coccineum]
MPRILIPLRPILGVLQLWLPSPLVEFRKRAWSIIAWMDSGVMLFGLVSLTGVFGPLLVVGAMICLDHKRQNMRESLPSGPGAYDQSLKALLTQPAASESESRVPDAVSE